MPAEQVVISVTRFLMLIVLLLPGALRVSTATPSATPAAWRSVAADESGSGTSSNTNAPPALKRLVHDTFLTDPRQERAVAGDVSWQPGALTLHPGGSITREIEEHLWVQQQLAPAPTIQPDSVGGEIVLSLLRDEAPDVNVRLRSDADGASVTLAVQSAAIDATGPSEAFRERTLSAAEFRGPLIVAWRFGLIRVGTPHEPLLTALADQNAIPITGLRIESVSGTWRLERWSVEGAISPWVLPEGDAADDEALGDEIARLEQNAEYGVAATRCEERVRLRRAALGARNPDYASALTHLGLLCTHSRDYERAESALREAARIQQALLGPHHPIYAATLNNLGMLYNAQGDMPRAAAEFRDALRIKDAVLGEGDPSTVLAMNNLGGVLTMMGDFANGSKLLHRALEIRRSQQQEPDEDFANSLGNLASLYAFLGDYSRARPLYEEALAIQKDVLGEQHPSCAVTLSHLARLHATVGNYAQATPLYRQALAIQRGRPGPPDSDYARSLNTLARMYQSMGDFAQARSLFEESANVFRDAVGSDHADYGTALHALGQMHAAMGDDASAEAFFDRAIQVWRGAVGEQHGSYATGLSSQAGLAAKRGQYAVAEELLQRALRIREATVGPAHPDFATTQSNFAKLRQTVGDHTRALALYREVLRTRREVFGDEHPSVALSLRQMAAAHAGLGDLQAADSRLAEALAIQTQHLRRSALVQSSRQQMMNQARERRYLDSRLALAAEHGSNVRSVVRDVWQWKGAVTRRQRAYREVAANPKLSSLFGRLRSVNRRLSSLADQRPLPPPVAADEAEQVQYQQRRGAWEARFSALRVEREQLEQQIAAASEPFRRLRDPLTVAEVQQCLPAESALIDFLEYTHAAPDDGLGDAADDAAAEARRFVAFVIRPDREPVMLALGAAAEIRDAVTALRRPLNPDHDSAAARQSAAAAAGELHAQLWAPLKPHLDGVQTLVISPDTVLGTLPFAALPGSEDGSFLIEDYRIALLPMAGLLPGLVASRSDDAGEGLLLVGNVDYDARPDALRSQSDTPLMLADAGHFRGRQTEWSSLPGFRDELQVVEQFYRQAFGDSAGLETLTGGDASETALLAQAPQSRALHLITHGYFEAPDVRSLRQAAADAAAEDQLTGGADPFFQTWMPGLLSGLVLAGANAPSTDPDDPRDGILRASEIEAASLQGVDLVVLSACETGLGAVAGGEGLTGLQRAFHIAGSRSVVASLWQVSDQATLTLMTEFYRNLWLKKMSKLDALREAQLTMLRHYDADTGELRGLGGNVARADSDSPQPDTAAPLRLDPRYWAAFQLSGDWR